MIDEGGHIVAGGDETPLFRMPAIQRKQGTAITTARVLDFATSGHPVLANSLLTTWWKQ